MRFFDINILVAASVSDHPHHEPSRRCLSVLTTKGGACGAHSLAETYAVLTRFAGGYGVPPGEANRVIEYASETFTLVTLTARETLSALEAAAQAAFRGGMIFDVLLLACARKIDAETIYAYNVKHLRQIAPDLTARIVQP